MSGLGELGNASEQHSRILDRHDVVLSALATGPGAGVEDVPTESQEEPIFVEGNRQPQGNGNRSVGGEGLKHVADGGEMNTGHRRIAGIVPAKEGNTWKGDKSLGFALHFLPIFVGVLPARSDGEKGEQWLGLKFPFPPTRFEDLAD